MIYNVRDYGVIDGAKPQTAAIQAVIDLCHENGGGEVIVPEGMYRVAGLLLRSGVALHLLSGAMLLGSDIPTDYGFYKSLVQIEECASDLKNKRPSVDRFSTWNNGIIKAIDATDISIIGEPYSYIDGVNCYDASGEEGYRGPHAINMWGCKNVHLSGYTIMNSANWAHAIFECEGVHIDGVTVKGGHDGIDVFRCKDVLIENCDLATGDDCIAGYGNLGVEVRDCKLNSACSVFRFGGKSVHIHDCTHTAPARYPHRFKLTKEERAARTLVTDACRTNTLTAFLFYSDVRFPVLAPQGDILVERCHFEEIDALFHMNFGNHVWCCASPLDSITFRDCTATVSEPTYISADSDTPFTLTLENVTLRAKDGCSDRAVIDGAVFGGRCISDTRFEGFASPTIIDRCGGEIRNLDSTEIAIVCKEHEKNLDSK